MKRSPLDSDANALAVNDCEFANLVAVFEMLAQWDQEAKQRADTQGDTLEPKTDSPNTEVYGITSVKEES